MPHDDIVNLQNAVAWHEQVLSEDAKEIRALKSDIKELLNLMRLLDTSAQKAVIGLAQENAYKDFNKRLKTMLEKHGLA